MNKKIAVVVLPFAAVTISLLIMKLYLSFISVIPIICIFHLFTGYYCPGCGGSRCVRAILNGNLLQAFINNPAVILAIISFALMYLQLVLKTFFKPRKIIPDSKAFYIVLSGILILYYISRNFIPFMYPK